MTAEETVIVRGSSWREKMMHHIVLSSHSKSTCSSINCDLTKTTTSNCSYVMGSFFLSAEKQTLSISTVQMIESSPVQMSHFCFVKPRKKRKKFRWRITWMLCLSLESKPETSRDVIILVSEDCTGFFFKDLKKNKF